MWRISNLLFGWDYVYWKNSCDQGIGRVRRYKDGTVYYCRYRINNVYDDIKDPEDVRWLTCHPSKYFN